METIQRKVPQDGGGAEMDVPPILEDILPSSGQPLDAATQLFVEERFARGARAVAILAGSRRRRCSPAVRRKSYRANGGCIIETISNFEIILANYANWRRIDLQLMQTHYALNLEGSESILWQSNRCLAFPFALPPTNTVDVRSQPKPGRVPPNHTHLHHCRSPTEPDGGQTRLHLIPVAPKD